MTKLMKTLQAALADAARAERYQNERWFKEELRFDPELALAMFETSARPIVAPVLIPSERTGAFSQAA